MKPVPSFCGALLLLYVCPTPCDGQDLTPHQEAAKQIDSCLTLADQRIAVLSERLRELKTQNQRLKTLEDALSKATLQKSLLEAELHAKNANANETGNADLEYALSDALKISNAYREETERLRQDIMRLTQLANLAASDKERRQLAEQEHANQAKEFLADLEKRLTDREVELTKLRTGLNQKEKAWQQERNAFQTKQNAFQAEIATARHAQTVMQGDFLQIDPIRYELNSSQINEEQARILARAQKILQIYPNASFEIRGHTCILGSEERNQILSEQRAKRLLDFLTTSGIAPKQLSSAGFGESKPIADNSTDAGRRENRRVEIRVKSADGKTVLDTEDRP